MTNIRPFRFFAAAILTGVFLASCDESLPPRDMQAPRMEVQIGVLDTLVNLSTFPQQGYTMIVGSGGSVYLRITSLHDEVLQGDYSPGGGIDLWLERDPSLHSHLDVASLRPANPNDIQGGMLTLFPGTPVRLTAQWSHQTDDAKPYWLQANRTYYAPPIGYPYFETEPLTFLAQGSAQLFGETGAIYAGRIRFRLVYREYFVGGSDTSCVARTEPPQLARSRGK